METRCYRLHISYDNTQTLNYAFKEYKHGSLNEKWAAFLFMGNPICRDAVQGLFSPKIAQKNVQLPLIKKIHLVVISVKQKIWKLVNELN